MIHCRCETPGLVPWIGTSTVGAALDWMEDQERLLPPTLIRFQAQRRQECLHAAAPLRPDRKRSLTRPTPTSNKRREEAGGRNPGGARHGGGLPSVQQGPGGGVSWAGRAGSHGSKSAGGNRQVCLKSTNQEPRWRV